MSPKKTSFQVLESTAEENEITEITPDKIINRTCILVEFVTERKRKRKYYYISVTQADLGEEGEMQVMLLNACDDTSPILKVGDNDIAYIQFEQIQNALPLPTAEQKGDRLFYKFPHPVVIFEKQLQC